eukprot:TRINITY_DN80961_c0_g1_i1.p1 TRINITY_DN80961_c0_g1~~TRINITY_DN80961_c0_g1_i1.p1  ORF type:complete len:969 (+),score=244.85 TRINITY_DN80961_c0_g1_i1:84-2990(+)
MAEAEKDEPPKGVIVCVRVRPMFRERPDGTAGREASCKQIVEMDGVSDKCGSLVTRVFDPNNPPAFKDFAFDRSYWSSSEYTEDRKRPGVHIPDGPNSKYVSQDMVWHDLGQIMMNNILNGYNCTVFAYGQSGAGKSYSVVGYPPNDGIIPHTVTALYDIIDTNEDPTLRYEIEIAMLEVYMDEVYDLLEPKKQERTKLRVARIGNDVLIYDPKDRDNLNKIWRAARDREQCDSFRNLGDANRTVRPTGMNPTSSRGHTLFIMRFRKEKRTGQVWSEEFRTKVTLVDLAGSERAHDTGLKGIGLEEGVAINRSLTNLGNCLVSRCKGEQVAYPDKLTKALSESLDGNAITIMIAAISPADINYGDTLSTLRFADNAKRMPVKAKKQLDPTAVLIAGLREENARLQKQLEALSTLGGSSDEQERKQLEEKLALADRKVAEAQRALEEMEVRACNQERVHLAALAIAQDEAARSKQELESVTAELKAERARAVQAAKSIDVEMSQLQNHSAAQVSNEESSGTVPEQVQDLLQKKAAAESHVAEIRKKEEAHFEQLLLARFEDVEQLQTRRHELRMSLVKAKALSRLQGGKRRQSSAAVTEQEADLARLEENLVSARASAESLQGEALSHDLAESFEAASLAIAQQDKDAEVAFIQEQMEVLQSSKHSKEDLERLDSEKAAAADAAAEAALEARSAAEKVLEKQRKHLQAITSEQEQILLEVRAQRASLGDGEVELREKQAAIQGILKSELESWEKKLQAADESERLLKKSFEDMGLSVTEMLQSAGEAIKNSICPGGLMPPHLINLCEEAHEEGLVYFVPDGLTSIKRLQPGDNELGIKLDGPTICPLHATLLSDGERVLITPGQDDAVTFVNGEPLLPGSPGVELVHSARIIFGNDFVFRYVDPRCKKSPGSVSNVIDWRFAVSELEEKQGSQSDSTVLLERLQELEQQNEVLENKLKKEKKKKRGCCF